MRKALLLSAWIHASLFAATMFKMPLNTLRVPSVEIALVQELPEKPIKKPPPAPKPPAPKPQEEAPKPEVLEDDPEAVAIPDPKTPQKPKTEPKTAQKPVPKPKPPRLKKKAKANVENRIEEILRNVEKRKPSEPPPQQTKKEPSKWELSALQRAIKQQMKLCWRIDPGTRLAESLAVDLQVNLRPNGSILSATIIDQTRLAQDSYFRSAAENAIYAVHRCSPFQLPFSQYDTWKSMKLRFDPQEML